MGPYIYSILSQIELLISIFICLRHTITIDDIYECIICIYKYIYIYIYIYIYTIVIIILVYSSNLKIKIFNIL